MKTADSHGMGLPVDLTLEAARPADRAAIVALLRQAGLPAEDFATHLDRFIVARSRTGAIVGAIGAEVYGKEALLRSLVVAEPLRRAGLGAAMLHALEAAAASWGVERWWLLTTTADAFFLRHGFVAAAREAAPPAIAATREFRELCSSVARCFTRERRE